MERKQTTRDSNRDHTLPDAPRGDSAFLNIAGYRFVVLDDLPSLRDRLADACARNGLRGTILLAAEGVNFFVAGPAPAVDALIAVLQADARLSDIALKRSWSATIPFRRLKVRIKREIITMERPDIDPARSPAPGIEPELLKAWLDDGREVILLDTRNRFEFEHGTFENALQLGNRSFREFADAALQLAQSDAGVPIVAFCTGGIRCEKAAPLLERLGHRNVYQLSGGILRYFERAGAAHFRGDCFVFDERIALDAALRPSPQPDQTPMQTRPQPDQTPMQTRPRPDQKPVETRPRPDQKPVQL